MPGRSMNVFDLAVMDELGRDRRRDRGERRDQGRDHHLGQGDASPAAPTSTMLERMLGEFRAAVAAGHREEAAAAALSPRPFRLGDLFRRLETCGKPVVAAINGTCLGGAFELALACHGRDRRRRRQVRLGLPEVKVGLLPGAGGTQRRGAAGQHAGCAARCSSRASSSSRRRAKALGLVDAVVPADDLIRRGEALAEGDAAEKSRRGTRTTSGRRAARSTRRRASISGRRRTRSTGRRPTTTIPARATSSPRVFEGLQLPFDQALKVEQRYFAKVIQTRRGGGDDPLAVHLASRS